MRDNFLFNILNMMQQFHSSKAAERNDEFYRRYDINDQSNAYLLLA